MGDRWCSIYETKRQMVGGGWRNPFTRWVLRVRHRGGASAWSPELCFWHQGIREKSELNGGEQEA